eukprot:CAMPEP_0119310626 /NCGR_PEP_ID=MMETSP1333-20130426/19675_1 /TAXON_ID=418940 /ORGANISM="Scyphosphaera apsteinii, Strain RCC1455" /LENGTH=470 /DNA_ID=CAMNT_0007314841 /DNA_START=69 /DNA_END=1481 /DNA_ORIENTATION=-
MSLSLAVSISVMGVLSSFKPASIGVSSNNLISSHLGRSSMIAMSDMQYDLAAPTYDWLEGREFRRSTMLQYGVSQRSQQLRIIFFTSSSLISLLLPYLSTELFASAPFTALGLAGCAVSALAFGAAGWSEKKTRGKVLVRMERELRLGELSIWQPYSAIGGDSKRALSDLRGKRRVVALCGEPSKLLAALQSAAVYRRRLAQSGIVLVGVLADGCTDDFVASAYSSAARAAEGEGWLWQPTDLVAWRVYFTELLSGSGCMIADGAWLALSLQGRSCASGVGSPTWDELLGTKFPPLGPLSRSEPAAKARGNAEMRILAAQRKLYAALSSANAEGVVALCLSKDDAEVTQLQQAGRLDGWETVLKGSATIDLTVSSQDVTVDPNQRKAFTTALEFPKDSKGNSLLSTQLWVLSEGEGMPPEWLLAQHRTIPYTEDIEAAACLRCDHRGCTALQRDPRVASGPAGMPGDGKA